MQWPIQSPVQITLLGKPEPDVHTFERDGEIRIRTSEHRPTVQTHRLHVNTTGELPQVSPVEQDSVTIDLDRALNETWLPPVQTPPLRTLTLELPTDDGREPILRFGPYRDMRRDVVQAAYPTDRGYPDDELRFRRDDDNTSRWTRIEPQGDLLAIDFEKLQCDDHLPIDVPTWTIGPEQTSSTLVLPLLPAVRYELRPQDFEVHRHLVWASERTSRGLWFDNGVRVCNSIPDRCTLRLPADSPSLVVFFDSRPEKQPEGRTAILVRHVDGRGGPLELDRERLQSTTIQAVDSDGNPLWTEVELVWPGHVAKTIRDPFDRHSLIRPREDPNPVSVRLDSDRPAQFLVFARGFKEWSKYDNDHLFTRDDRRFVSQLVTVSPGEDAVVTMPEATDEPLVIQEWPPNNRREDVEGISLSGVDATLVWQHPVGPTVRTRQSLSLADAAGYSDLIAHVPVTESAELILSCYDLPSPQTIPIDLSIRHWQVILEPNPDHDPADPMSNKVRFVLEAASDDDDCASDGEQCGR